jgi:glycosyltransferase involved in cell wall biosynthesis
MVLADLNGGGVQRVMLTLAAGFAERGHEVELIVGDPTGRLRADVSPKLRVTALPPSPSVRTRWLPLRADPGGAVALLPLVGARRTPPGLDRLSALADALGRGRPDALVSGTPIPNLLAVWARTLSGVGTRILLTEHLAPSQKGRRPLVPLVRRTYERADAIAAVSRALGDDLAEFAGVPRARIATLYNPVVHEGIESLARAGVAHPWFAPNAPPVVLGVGRLTPQKDFPTLIRAFALLRRRRPARLVILGAAKNDAKTAQQRAELTAEAAQLGVADDVALPGFTDNPFAWMANAAVFALSSRFEGLGNVLIEAMACGCPVVSTDCKSGPAEILEDGRHGPLVPIADPPALAAALERVLDAPPDRAALRRRAADFSVERAIDAYLALLFPES